MDSKIYIPYIPLKSVEKEYQQALKEGKVDNMGFIWGDKKRGDGMSYEEYDRKLNSEWNNSRNISMYLSGGYDVSYLNKKYGVLDYQKMQKDNTKWEYYELSCPIMNMRKNIMQPEELVKCRMENLMFIMIIDIPKNIDSDVESELRFWVRDSMEINVHHEIPEDERLRMLPTKDLKLKIDDIEGTLVKCRVIDFQKPFRIMLMVERFTR